MQNSEYEEFINNNINKYNNMKEKCKILQNKYIFEIPDYVLEEIVKLKEDNSSVQNLALFINLACLNNRLSSEQAEILKKEYVNNQNFKRE